MEKKIREIIQEEVDHFFAENLEPLIKQEVLRILDVREMDKQLAEADRWKERKKQDLVKKLEAVRWCLDNYVDSNLLRIGRPTIILADQMELGLGYAAHLSGDPGDFKKLSFEGYSHFYELPLDKRNQFLREGLKEFRRILGEEVNPKLDLEELQQKFDLLQKSFERIRSAL